MICVWMPNSAAAVYNLFVIAYLFICSSMPLDDIQEL